MTVRRFDVHDLTPPQASTKLLVSDAAKPGDTILWSAGLFAPTAPGKVAKLWLPVHCFIGAQFFDSSGAYVVPSAGSIVINVQTANNYPVWEILGTDEAADSTITATAAETLSWNANVVGVRAVPTGLADLDHWRLVVTGNQH